LAKQHAFVIVVVLDEKSIFEVSHRHIQQNKKSIPVQEIEKRKKRKEKEKKKKTRRGVRPSNF
jgi:hypothetical protein